MDSNSCTPPLLTTSPKPAAAAADDVFLRRFLSSLKWCGLDHSSFLARTASYFTFVFLAVVIPLAVTLLHHRHSASAAELHFNELSQLPESVLATISFLTLSSYFHHPSGIRQLLLVDGLGHDSVAVSHGYARQIDRTYRYLAAILLPSFAVELAHKTVIFDVPAGARTWRAAALVAAALTSWVYRTGVFLLVCVLFRLTCELQIQRFEEFYELFAGGGEAPEKVEAVMFREHVRIRTQLKATSHRYRVFILGCLVTITVSQLGALIMVLATKSDKNFSNSGDLVVCSVVQLSGFLMCLFGAARITHKAQRVVSIASQWHMILSSSCNIKLESVDELEDKDCESDNPLEPSIRQLSSNFECRQALVTYLQHNGGGITIFGFALDRSLLHALFAFEMTLVLWILSKVVVLS